MTEEVREALLRYIETEDTAIASESMLQEDLFLNSLDFIYVIMDLEVRYSVEFTDEEIGNMRTAGDLAERLEQKVKERCHETV